MSLKLGLLGLLSIEPQSGYDLAKIFENSLHYVWSASHSQIYPELARLQDDGLIKTVERGARGRKAYCITAKGRRALARWLTETEPDRNDRNEAFMRMFFLWTLAPEDAQAFLEREIEWHRAGLAQYEGILGLVEGDAEPPPWGRLPIELGVRYKHMMIDYLKWAKREVRKESKAKPSTK